MSTDHADEAVRIRDEAGLSDQLIAPATGAAPSTVRGWLAHRSSPSGRRAERVGELPAIVARLPRVMRADYIPVWLVKPIDVIARGDYRQVARLEASGAV
jgi:hypothetical protein